MVTDQIKQYMSENGKKGWKNLSPEERSQIMSERSKVANKKRWENTTVKERREHSKKMNDARYGRTAQI